MSENTKIEWCDHCWSPWRVWVKDTPNVMSATWVDPVRWNAHWSFTVQCSNCGWRGDQRRGCGCHYKFHTASRPRVFPSLCDWLDEEVPIEWLARFLTLIHDTPNLDWLLLTKRPENWYRKMWDALLLVEGITDPNLSECDPETEVGAILNDWLRMNSQYAPSNVWIGTSVEDQPNSDRRIPELLKIPARLRFLSVDPMLGPVNLEMALEEFQPLNSDLSRKPSPTHWVIVGGESGPGARPCNVDWVRSVARQCAAANVRCFVNQLGANPVYTAAGIEFRSSDGLDNVRSHWDDPGWFMPWNSDHNRAPKITHPKGADPEEWPEDLRVRQFPEVRP